MLRLAHYPHAILRDKAPPSHGITGGSGLYINAGDGLNIERTQPWSCLVDWAGSYTPAGFALFFTNVHAAPEYSGYEFGLTGQGSPFIRIISDIRSNYLGCSSWNGIADDDYSDGTRRRLGISYDGSSTPAGVKFYTNGVQRTTRTEAGGDTLSASILIPGNDLWVANQEFFTTQFFMPGTMYGLEIAHVERSASWFSRYAAEGDWPLPSTETELSYRFTEGAGTTTRDDSANNFTGALSSAALWV